MSRSLAIAALVVAVGCSAKAPRDEQRSAWVTYRQGHAVETVSQGIAADEVLPMDSLGEPLFAALVLSPLGLPPNQEIDRCGAARAGIVFGRTGKNARKPTVAQVLSHQSGLANRANSTLLTFEPGTRWSRSDDAMLCLQRNLERQRESDFEEVAQSGLLSSLELLNSGWVRNEAGRPHASRTFSSSLPDLSRFLSCVLSRACPGLPASVLTLQESAQIVADPALEVSWGLGWAVFSDSGATVLAHFGQTVAGYRLMLAIPSAGDGAVVFVEGSPAGAEPPRAAALRIARKALSRPLTGLDSRVFDRSQDKPTIDLNPSPHQHHH